ncbi:MAG TPA: hypothetical protein PK605_12510 [Ignavibacteria bacterium]|nr:hypothetical protein [Bacteroidota bacterium]HRE11165.1 hypothetical protein [Ignavibacteria bacterium]HRF64793.1 hypothetical protein [Ignavibacteria bacterium]HRJ05214.1 hypothetical protein [Ignavibacteria bacterium]HRJ85777.1 hypothetical protein [Ignavibacteria bacterium]
MNQEKIIIRNDPKKKIIAMPIDFNSKYNHNFIRIANVTKDIRPTVLSNTISNFLNSEFGAKQILIEDEKINNDIKKKKKYILKEKAKNLIANKHK